MEWVYPTLVQKSDQETPAFSEQYHGVIPNIVKGFSAKQQTNLQC